MMTIISTRANIEHILSTLDRLSEQSSLPVIGYTAYTLWADHAPVDADQTADEDALEQALCDLHNALEKAQDAMYVAQAIANRILSAINAEEG